MAMVVSTPRGPFKTPYPCSFWFSSPPLPCRLLGSATWMASSSSPNLYPRRVFSSSAPNFSSYDQCQRNSIYLARAHNIEDHIRQRASWHDTEPENPSSSTSSWHATLGNHWESENLRSPTSSAPLYDTTNIIFEGTKSSWKEECAKMNQFKLQNERSRQSNLVVLHGTENCSAKSMGSQDGSAYAKGISSDSSFRHSQPVYQSRVQTGDSGKQCLINGRGTGISPFRGTDQLEKMDLPMKQDTEKVIQSDVLNGKHLKTVEQNPACMDRAKFCGSKTPKVDPVNHRKNLSRIYDEVLVINNILSAKKVVELLTTKYRNLVHACDTEVAKIDVKQETPVDHGEIICFSIYSGSEVDFGNGKSCIWVDVMDGGGRELLMEFAPFFEDSSIKKVWHNYSFDSHVIENYGIKLSGFHADTMHMARLWDSSRRTDGGYSLEALTSNSKVMNGAPKRESNGINGDQSTIHRELIGKISMKTIFGKKKLRRDGTEGKLTAIAPVEELQREERMLWICYSALDSMSTLQLFESLQSKLETMQWVINRKSKGHMYDFYKKYWRPFGELLVKMETEGMLVDRAYLAEIQKVATLEQQIATNRFRNWAAKRCPDAIHMNVGSDTQLRQLFFGGTVNSKDQNEALPLTRSFKVPNIDGVVEEGKTVPSKFRNITLGSLGVTMETEMYTATGWPSVSGDALKTLAGKVSSEYDWIDDAHGFESDIDNPLCDIVDASTDKNGKKGVDVSSYGTAYKAFGENNDGKEACHAIAALCEVCSIGSLISNFILPLQSNHKSGKNGRIHCSLNINTETGRLSARRPNLQNQPALEKDRYKIRQAFIAAPGNSLIVADYGQLELRILAHLANCKSMKDAFKAGGDFHSRTAMNMYSHIREAVEKQEVLLEWHPQPGEDKPPAPLLKDAFASERRKAKMLNFSIAYGKTPVGLARDWKVSVNEARETVNLWYRDRKEVLSWQKERKEEANKVGCVKTLLGRTRSFPSMKGASNAHKGHIERAAINTPVQGSAADVAMCAMLEISENARLKELGWRLLLQVHDEVILEGPTESAEVAKAIVVECMSKPFDGKNILTVDLAVDAKCAQNWYAAK